MIRELILSVAIAGLAGCAMTSGVMPSENGTYLISAHAAPARRGAAGAEGVAYSDAQKFCAANGANAVVVTTGDRDVYQGAFGASRDFASGGTFAAGNAMMRFKCVAAQLSNR